MSGANEGSNMVITHKIPVDSPGSSNTSIPEQHAKLRQLRNQLLECERLLLAENFDLRIYDILAVGNPILRSWLAREMQSWGLSVTTDQVYLGLGAMDCLNKVLCGLSQVYREQDVSEFAILF